MYFINFLVEDSFINILEREIDGWMVKFYLKRLYKLE